MATIVDGTAGVNRVAITAPATAATLTIADGKTLTASNSVTLAGTDSTTMTFPPASSDIGYVNVPQNLRTTSYTCVLTDSGKNIHCATGGTFTMTVPANGTVAFPIGTVLTFTNLTGNAMTIALTTDTMYLAASGSGASRSLANLGMASMIKVAATIWIIAGTGLT